LRILYLTQYFGQATDAGSGRHFFFTKYAVERGHDVAVITSNVDYKNAQKRKSGKNGRNVRTNEGVEIQYVYSYSNFRGSILKRMLFFASYVFFSLGQAVRVKRPDIVYAVSTPLTVGLLGFLISRYWRVPYVFEVGDVWPDAVVACGIVKNKLIIRSAHLLEMFCYRKAAHVVGLSRLICDNIVGKGVPCRKVSLITNGVDFSLFTPDRHDEKRNAARVSGDYRDRFVAMYMGAHGIYNALDTIMIAARALKDDPRVMFVFVGNGDEKGRMQSIVRGEGLKSVCFLPTVSRLESISLLAAADAFLLPNRKGDYFACNLPNKLFDYLASARPIVVAGYGETSEIVSTAGCGIVVPAEDGAAMAEAILSLVRMPLSDREAMGQKGRAYVQKHYDREQLGEKFLNILDRSAAPRRGTAIDAGF